MDIICTTAENGISARWKALRTGDLNSLTGKMDRPENLKNRNGFRICGTGAGLRKRIILRKERSEGMGKLCVSVSLNTASMEKRKIPLEMRTWSGQPERKSESFLRTSPSVCIWERWGRMIPI